MTDTRPPLSFSRFRCHYLRREISIVGSPGFRPFLVPSLRGSLGSVD